MNYIDLILESLSISQEPYSLSDFSRYIGISIDKTEKIIGFLSKFNFITLKDSYITVSPQTRKVFHEPISTSSKNQLVTVKLKA